MSSVERDESLEAGEPIYLYTFTRGTVSWRYTNSDRNEVFGGHTFLTTAIDHSAIKTTGSNESSDVSITLPRSLSVAENWFPWPPSDIIMCMIQTVHEGEADAQMIWIGRLVQPKFSDNELTLLSEPYVTSGRAVAPAPRIQRSCRKTLYGPQCKVDPEAHRVAGTIASIDGFVLNIAAAATFPNGRLVNGAVEWERPDGLKMSRTIEQHEGASVVIDYGDLSLEELLDVTLLPGCRQSFEDCRDYFENELNCGAQKYIPIRNPHDGNPVR